ncbi:MAG: nucleoside monophosphate kinase, partial [Defluviitaleaceae bacterium]|nr:nucleoside monophosphate kinase [Defluviitaleaceae bacterium]
MSKKPLKLVVIGAPGAGKGTQAKLLAARLSIPHISSGDLLREHIAAGDEIGVTACSLMKDGNLVPDDIVISLVKEFIEGESF